MPSHHGRGVAVLVNSVRRESQPATVLRSNCPRGRVRRRAVVVCLCGWLVFSLAAASFSPADERTSGEPAYRQQLCSHCHRLPEPSILPKDAWPSTIYQMGGLGGFGVNVSGAVDLEAVVDWYVSHAKAALPPAESTAVTEPMPQFLPSTALKLRDTNAPPFVSNLLITPLTSSEPQLVLCDMKNGGVWVGDLTDGDWSPKQIATLASPARAEAADLDGDGRMDLVVAVLGSPMAMDHLLGEVLWLRQLPDQGFEPIVLADGLGRVADVQPVDIDGDGDLDLAVAEFGWRQTGHVLLLENQSGPSAPPRFTRNELDGNHGACRIAATDIDQDGRLDLVALFAQEHERVRVYRNGTDGWSETHDIWRAPHPAWGHSSMQVVDLDADGDPDILLTNGDSYDNALLKPDHGIRWLENQGNFTFVAHDIAPMPGSYAAAAADLDDDGDLDLVVSALAEPEAGSVTTRGLASLIWLEQATPGKFRSHVLEVGDLRHPVILLHDTNRDGRADILVGNGCFDDTALEPSAPGVQIWLNRGR